MTKKFFWYLFFCVGTISIAIHAMEADQPDYDLFYKNCVRHIKKGQDFCTDALGKSLLSEITPWPLKEFTRFAELLVQEGKVRITGKNVLIAAAQDDGAEKVRKLKQLGADLKTLNDEGTPLITALSKPFRYQPIPPAIPLPDGSSLNLPEPLFAAIRLTRDKAHSTIKALLLNGVPVDARGHSQCTALMHAAALAEFSDVFALLQEFGADVHLKSCTGETLLHCAVARPQPNSTILKMLFKTDLDINAVNNYCDSPLAHALSVITDQADNHENIQLLLDHGASSFVVNDEGHRPLSMAKSLPEGHPARCAVERAALEERAMRPRTIRGYQMCKEGGLPTFLIDHVFSFLNKLALRKFILKGAERILPVLNDPRPERNKWRSTSRLSFLSTKVEECQHFDDEQE